MYIVTLMDVYGDTQHELLIKDVNELQATSIFVQMYPKLLLKSVVSCNLIIGLDELKEMYAGK